ncbi:hypothetical protein F0562_014527 [Nyssa sinensis]|uniref:Large ribosomal subunit protein uL6 N-terminal domain-containing protein n=1 Tax=Nyssa sinensis TaxID=561372 RepID=A0A5J4ZT66_9ASTE|nr:hypothetical protein F0562_014527 [Nyssa sinensis]
MAPKQKTPKVSRNPDLIRGIGKYSRSKMYHKRGLWAIKAKNGGVFPRHDKKPAEPKPAEKPPKFYPADDVKKPFINKRKPKPTKLKASITPGTVLIILAGRFKGKRVRVSETAFFWVASGYWTIQDQWCSSKTCESVLCNWYFDQG